MVNINIRQSETGYSSKLYIPDLVWNNDTSDADLKIKDFDLQSENLIYTGIIIQLFTDLKADESDNISEKDAGGWIGNCINDDDVIGSYLWTIEKSLLNQDYINKATRYINLALDSFIEQKLILKYSVSVTIDKVKKLSIMDISITKNDKTDLKFEFAWGQIYGS